MKTNILRMLMTTVLFAGLSMAQDQKRGRMAQELGLNEDQKSQVQSIMTEQREAAKAARNNNASKHDMQAIRQKTHDRMAGVLNPDQMKKFEAGAKKSRKHRKPEA